MNTPEEQIAELKEALGDAHATIEHGVAVLERINRIITIGEESTTWIEDAKTLLGKDNALL